MNTQIYVMRPDGSGLKRLTAGGEENNFLGEWTHDGRWLGVSTNAQGASTTESFLVDPRTGERQAVATSQGLGSILDVTRDGKWALVERASGRGNNDLHLVELPSRRH